MVHIFEALILNKSVLLDLMLLDFYVENVKNNNMFRKSVWGFAILPLSALYRTQQAGCVSLLTTDQGNNEGEMQVIC